jgi:DNA-directed RNA polymerase specialized sigma24 family protein
MSSPGSVSHWISQLKAGDQAAAGNLWEGYYRQLVARARQKLLGKAPRRAADEEDVALSAFDSFCRAAEQGRFPRLNDRDDLWQLLILITDRKAIKLVKHGRRQKRGGGKVLDEAGLRPQGAPPEGSPFDQMLGREPSPEFAAEVAEEYERLLRLLQDDNLRIVAERKMQGYTVEEIANDMCRGQRTVKRWMSSIRQMWEQELVP